MMTEQARSDIVVIGAGQAGLSAGYFLVKRELMAGPDFQILDANPSPGGAWQHRWASLTMDRANHFADLPGMPLGEVDGDRSAADVIAEYFRRYERTFGLQVRRPVRVRSVAPLDPGSPLAGPLVVDTEDGQIICRAIINATGTWDSPFWPHYPGQERFRGRQLHGHDYTSAAGFAGQNVMVIGGGNTAVQILLELSGVANTTWVTRRPPEFSDEPFTAERGRRAVALVEQRVRQGLPPGSVVSVTGLPRTPAIEAAIDAGILTARPMFSRITADGVQWADGSSQQVDVLLWCTGFRATLDHLAPLHLREAGGGIVMHGTAAARDPRVHLLGYGPSAHTLGASRAARQAVAALTAARQSVG